MACSAVVMELPNGVFITTIPFAVAAGMSTLSTPMPARPMTFRFFAAAMTSGLTLVAERIARPSYVPMISFSFAASGPICGRKSTSRPRALKMPIAAGDSSSEIKTFGISCLLAPIGAVQAMDKTIVLPVEEAAANSLETEPPVEAMRMSVRVERVNDDGGDRRIGEARVNHRAHHQCAIALVAVAGVADPDVDGPQVLLDCTPIMRRFAVRIDHLHRADRAAIEFGNVVASAI